MAANRIKGITIEIGGDTTKLDKALSGVNKTLKDSQTQLKDVNKLLKLDPGNTELLKQKYEALTKSVDATKEKLETLKKAGEQANEALAKGDISQAQYDALQREIIETENNLKSLTDEYKEFGSVAEQQIKQAGESVSAFGDKISDAGRKMGAISAGAAAIGGASIAAAKELDAGYDTIITKTGASGEALEDLKTQMDNLYTSIPTDAEKAGIAIGEVNTRFHLTGEELGNLSADFIRFAEINGTDLNKSIDSVDSIMKKFNVDVSQTTNVLGLFTKAGQDSGISIDTIESSLEKNGAALKEMGFGLTESVNLLAQLESNGVDTSTAMAGLKKAVSEAAKDGLGADDALKQTIESIKNAKTETEALQTATELFGNKGAAEMSQAIREGRLDIDSLTSSLNDYSSTVTDTFEATLDPWDEAQTALNNLKLTGAELGAELLSTLKPAIDGLVDGAKNLKNWFSGLDENQKGLIVKIGLVVAAIAPLLTIIGKVTSGVGTIISIGSKLVPLIAGISAPVLGVVAAVAALVAIGVALYKNWDTIKAKAGELKENLSAKWEDMKTNMSEKWEDMKTNAAEKWEEMKNNIANSKLAEVAGNVLGAAKDVVKENLANMKKAFEENGGGFKGAISAAMEGVKGYFTSGFNFIDKLTNGKLTELKDKFVEKFDGIKNVVKDTIENVKSKFENLKLKLPDIKLPHFSLVGEFSLNPPKVPTLSVDWYAKAMNDGMILNSPTIFGAAGGRLLGAGEAGAEAVVGVGSLQSMIRNAVGSTGINTMVELMQQYLPYLAESKDIRLDSGALVGGIAPQMNRALGVIANREGRR